MTRFLEFELDLFLMVTAGVLVYRICLARMNAGALPMDNGRSRIELPVALVTLRKGAHAVRLVDCSRLYTPPVLESSRHMGAWVTCQILKPTCNQHEIPLILCGARMLLILMQYYTLGLPLRDLDLIRFLILAWLLDV